MVASVDQTARIWDVETGKPQIVLRGHTGPLRHILFSPNPAAPPRIVTVSPSRRVGNFFTGTLWFSPPQTARLIALGFDDMKRALSTVETDTGARTAGSARLGVAVDPAIG